MSLQFTGRNSQQICCEVDRIDVEGQREGNGHRDCLILCLRPSG